jgi:hypothetical protein
MDLETAKWIEKSGSLVPWSIRLEAVRLRFTDFSHLLSCARQM